MKTKKKTKTREIKPIVKSILTEAQIRLYHEQAEIIRKLEPRRLTDVSTDELIKKGVERMEKDNFKIATEELNNL